MISPKVIKNFEKRMWDVRFALISSFFASAVLFVYGFGIYKYKLEGMSGFYAVPLIALLYIGILVHFAVYVHHEPILKKLRPKSTIIFWSTLFCVLFVGFYGSDQIKSEYKYPIIFGYSVMSIKIVLDFILLYYMYLQCSKIKSTDVPDTVPMDYYHDDEVSLGYVHAVYKKARHILYFMFGLVFLAWVTNVIVENVLADRVDEYVASIAWHLSFGLVAAILWLFWSLSERQKYINIFTNKQQATKAFRWHFLILLGMVVSLLFNYFIVVHTDRYYINSSALPLVLSMIPVIVINSKIYQKAKNTIDRHNRQDRDITGVV